MAWAWIVGAALLGAGLFQPVPPVVSGEDPIQGEVTFAEALARGIVDVSTDDGALFALGPHRTTLTAERLSVTVIEAEWERRGVETPLPHREANMRVYDRAPPREETFALTNVAMTVVASSDGVLFAHGEPGAARFGAHIIGAPVPIRAVPHEVALWESQSQARHQHVLPAPVLGLANAADPRTEGRDTGAAPDGGDDAPPTPTFRVFDALPELPRTRLTTLEARGEVEAVLHRAWVEVASDQGAFTWVLEHTEEDVAAATAAGFWAGEARVFNRYMVLSGPVDLAVEVSKASAGLAGHRMRYDVNGTLAAEGAEGSLAGQRLKDAKVEARGLLVVEATPARPSGVDGPEPSTPVLNLQTALGPPQPAPASKASVRGDAEALAIGGRTVVRDSPLAAAAGEAPQALGAAVLLWVALKKLAAVLSPLYIANPLANPGRRAVHDAVHRTRIVHLRELQRLTGLRIGAVVHHVEVLRRFGMVATMRLGHQLIVYVPHPSLSLREVRELAVLTHPNRARIAALLHQGGSFTQKEVAEAAHLSLATASRHLGRLERAGLAVRTGTRNRRYRASDLLRTWLNGRGLTAAPAPIAVAETGA